MSQLSSFASLTKFQSSLDWDSSLACTEWHSVLWKRCTSLSSWSISCLRYHDHNIFFQKLFLRVGIGGTVLDWFNSYLEDRYQSVQVNCTTFTPRHLTFGQCEWSPRLLILFWPITEIAEKHGVSAHLYTDNTQLYIPFSLTEEDSLRAVLQMEDCIDDICKRMALINRN